jgi:bacteriophage N4 adsorption protein B
MESGPAFIFSTSVNELLLFSAVGFCVFGIDDLIVDLIWLVRQAKRSLTIYRRFPRACASLFPEPVSPFALAVLIPAWDESAVIGQMLTRCREAWGVSGYTIFVGYYPNDPLTFAVLEPLASEYVRLVKMKRDGPTTKADCLNHLWDAVGRFEVETGHDFQGIVLHDAEDYVHRDELRIFSALTRQLDMIQLPVQPEIDAQSRWISGHYLDEFAEAHLKEMVVREAIGASLPSAGTGCCIARAMLRKIASLNGGPPFDSDSLTEDYELGLRIGSLGGRSALIRIKESEGSNLVAVRAHFPATLQTALRQKSRWIVGIAFAGWDSTGWRGGLAEHWMLWRDRRSLLSALFILAGYLALGIGLLLLFAGHSPKIMPLFQVLLMINAVLLTWRIAMRALCVGIVFGRKEALRSFPRILISNLIAVLACFYAVFRYGRILRTGQVAWGKTSHQFPTTQVIRK